MDELIHNNKLITIILHYYKCLGINDCPFRLDTRNEFNAMYPWLVHAHAKLDKTEEDWKGKTSRRWKERRKKHGRRFEFRWIFYLIFGRDWFVKSSCRSQTKQNEIISKVVVAVAAPSAIKCIHIENRLCSCSSRWQRSIEHGKIIKLSNPQKDIWI